MADLRSSTDQTLLRLLRARAEADPAFRESLGRVVTAKARYEDYVDRKKGEGAPSWLPREDWEAWVFGHAPGEPRKDDAKKQRSPAPMRRKLMRSLWRKKPPTARKPKRLFSPEETRDLPRWAAQPHGKKDRLMSQAREAYPLMLDWLDRGEGVDKALGARTVRRDRDADAPMDLDKPGPVLIVSATKKAEEAEVKVRERYGGDWKEGAVDLVRATIAVDTYDQLPKVIETIKESGIDLAAKPRNRFRDETSSGYRDVVLSARLPNGHIMELQLHLKPMLKAKEENHPLYSEIKGLDDQVKRGGRGALAPEQMRLMEDNTRRMREAYDRAWDEATARSEPSSIFDAPKPTSRRKTLTAREAAEETFYFDMDGLPVRWRQPKLPEIHGGPETVPVDSLADFAERAVPIAEGEFEILVRARKQRRSGGDDDEEKKAAGECFADAMRRAAADPKFRRALREELRRRRGDS